PAARQGGFAFYSKVAWCCAGSENDRACFKDLVSDMDLLNVAFELYRIHDFHAQVSAETSGLSAHFFHELGAQDALLETRVVFHIGGVHQFATVFKALGDTGVQLCARCIKCGGVACWARPNNSDIMDGHVLTPLFVTVGDYSRQYDQQQGS